MTKSYIAPLDGLRAIAIILVLVFHVDHTLLPGGFVGVDVFFVVSGFIITRNITKEIEKNDFSVSRFYTRRFVRLFPASAVTVLLTLLFAVQLYSPETLASMGRSALYALLSVANVWYWLSSGYFEDVSSQNPLLHMWSLSVEEQFYLVWPALMILLTRLPGRLWAWMMLTFVASLALSWWWSSADPGGMFYLMPARSFQFAIGGLVAVSTYKPKEFLSAVCLLCGLLLIGISGVFANGQQYEFMTAALLPALGAAAAIFGLHCRSAEVLLANPAMRWVGLRAYSVYLVHWPIVVFAGTLLGSNRPISQNFILLVASLLAGDVLYRMVEKPLRLPRLIPGVQHKFSSLKVYLTVFLLSVGLVISAHVWALNQSNEGSTTAFVANASRSAVAAANTGEDPAAKFWASVAAEDISSQTSRLWQERSAVMIEKGKEGCALMHKAPYSDFPEEKCRSSTSARPPLLIGDSLAAEALVALEEVLPADAVAMAATPGCLPEYPEPGWDVRPDGCQELNIKRFEWLATDEFYGVIMAANWRWANEDRFGTMLTYLKEQGQPLIMFGPRPQFSESVPGLLKSAAGSRAADNLQPYTAYDMQEKDDEIRNVLDHSGIEYVYVPWGQMLCADHCRAYLPTGELAYLDQMHSPPGVMRWVGAQVSDRYSDDIRELLSQPQ